MRRNEFSVNDEDLMRKIEVMYLNNRSTSEIGEALGLTKNQVVGLVGRGRRHGYEFPKRPPNFWRARRSARGLPPTEMSIYKARETQKRGAKVKAAQFRRVRGPEDPPIGAAFRGLYRTKVEVTEIPEEGLQLLDVPTGGCKYPIGEKGGVHLFCAQPSKEGSYCGVHLKVMWPNRYR